MLLSAESTIKKDAGTLLRACKMNMAGSEKMLKGLTPNNSSVSRFKSPASGPARMIYDMPISKDGTADGSKIKTKSVPLADISVRSISHAKPTANKSANEVHTKTKIAVLRNNVYVAGLLYTKM